MPRSKIYVFTFAFAVCFFVSVSLALTVTALRKDQAQSVRLDIIQNILSVAGYPKEKVQTLLRQDPLKVITLFREKFNIRLLDHNNKEVAMDWISNELQGLGFTNADLKSKESFELVELFNSKIKLLAKRAGKTPKEYNPGLNLIFLYQPNSSKDLNNIEAYIIPVEGYGLWDMIYGYVALAGDLNTLRDIRFYKHQETPGLGGECSAPWFTNQFKGKKILNSKGSFVSIAVVKGKANELYPQEELDHYVDGISGGTITSKGITQFLKDDLGRYNKYFETLRRGTSQNSIKREEGVQN